jgi:hypothetical protein
MAVPRPALAAGLQVNVVHANTNVVLGERVLAMNDQIRGLIGGVAFGKSNEGSPIFLGDINDWRVESDGHSTVG